MVWFDGLPQLYFIPVFNIYVPFSHDTLHVGAQKQVLHADLYLFDVLNLDDMADVG